MLNSKFGAKLRHFLLLIWIKRLQFCSKSRIFVDDMVMSAVILGAN